MAKNRKPNSKLTKNRKPKMKMAKNRKQSAYNPPHTHTEYTLFVLNFARTKYCAILRTGTKLRSI